MITAPDEAEDLARRGHKQEAVDEAFVRQMLFAPSAAPATRQPKVVCQLHHLQQLMDENAAQHLQIQQKEREIWAAQIEIQELQDRQHRQKDSRPR